MSQAASSYRAQVILGTVLGLIVGGMVGYLTPHPAPPPPITVSTPPPTATSLPTSTPAPIRVYITGAVDQPAVYSLPPGSIVQDALEAAGGPTEDADLERINLAQELRDQQQVYVPRRGEAASRPLISGGTSGGSSTGTGLVNINTASAAELETLPRVGPSTAQRIIAYRQEHGPFSAIEDIQNVSGIGPATFEQLKDLITVGP